MAEQQQQEEGVPPESASKLPPGAAAVVREFLAQPELLRERLSFLEKSVETRVVRPPSLAAYLGRNFETTVPPLGYLRNLDPEESERYPCVKLFGARQRLEDYDGEDDFLSSACLVTEPIDFSSPGEATSFLYHYTERHVVDLIFDESKQVLVGGWLPMKTMQPGMLCTAGSGTFNDSPCIYVSSREPNSFIDKEAIAANNYGSRDHRMEKYGPDGAQHGGWEWKNSRGEPSPLGHHLAEVCIPLIVDVDALHKAEMTTPEDIAIGRQVYMFVPPDREGRMAAGATPVVQLLEALTENDIPSVLKLLSEGAVPLDYKMTEADAPRSYSGFNLLHMAACCIEGNSVPMFKALEACGVPYTGAFLVYTT